MTAHPPRSMRVGKRRDQQLIHPAELAELKDLAQDGKDMRAAIKLLEPKRYEYMEQVRQANHPNEVTMEQNFARGWLFALDALGDALLEVQRKRGEEAPF